MCCSDGVQPRAASRRTEPVPPGTSSVARPAITRNRCHAASVPGVDSMEAFLQAAAEFAVADLELQAEPSAAAAAQQSLDESGLLLLGEVHGVRENPLLVRALMRMFGLTSLALEWPVTWRLRWRPSWPGTRLPIIVHPRLRRHARRGAERRRFLRGCLGAGDCRPADRLPAHAVRGRSEEHTSELQS